MLRITLYENCILNNTYKNVISTSVDTVLGDNITILDKYLNSLSKKSFDIDNVYQENSGRFVFSYDIDLKNIYNYNYMKVETINIDEDEEETLLIKRYCFINSIQLKNGNVYLDYAEDYWSSYSDKIKGITESYLSRSRVLKYETKTIGLRKVPVAYDGNNPVKINPLITTETKQLSLLCQIQFYHSVSPGEFTDRFVKNFLINTTDVNSNIQYDLSNRHRVKDLIEKIISWQSVGEMTYGLVADYKYEVGDFYVFPADFYSLVSSVNMNIKNGSDTIYLFEVPEKNRTDEKTYTISANDKIISVGTFSSQIDIINNGTSIKVHILISNDGQDFAIHMNAMNKSIDITKDFLLTPAISSLKSEELSLYKLQKETKSLSLVNDYKIAEMKESYTHNYAVGDFLGYLGKVKGPLSGISVLGSQVSYAGKQGIEQTSEQLKMQDLTKQLELVNAPLYTSNKGVFGNNINWINGLNGICTFTIDSENDTYVRDTINNFGYETFEYVDNLDDIDFDNVTYFGHAGINYNVLKFEEIELYGSFTQEICSILKDILTSGIKLWYDERITKDNNPSPYV